MCLCEFDWSLFANVVSAIGSIVAAGITVFIYRFAKHELKRNNSIAEVDLYYKIKSDLMSEKSLSLYHQLTNDELSFDPEKEVFIRESQQISMYDVSLSFLGHIEDIAVFLKEGIISYEKINDGFGSMILEVGSTQSIRDFIYYSRNAYEDKMNNNWAGFERLYLRLYADLPDHQKDSYNESFPKYIPKSEN